MLTWFGIFLICLQVFSVLMTIGRIGKVREPITPGEAVFGTVFSSLIIIGILVKGTGHL